MTQDDVNKAFEEIKAEWDSMVQQSGMSEKMFVITGGSSASNFLMHYQTAKESVEGAGLLMPVLVEGLTITVGDSDDRN